MEESSLGIFSPKLLLWDFGSQAIMSVKLGLGEWRLKSNIIVVKPCPATRHRISLCYGL